MRLTRIHLAGRLAVGQEVALPAAAANHVSRVLRLRAGASLQLFNGSGHDYAGTIVRIAGTHVVVRIDSCGPGVRESSLRITLAQGVSRSERMDWTLQKATELGVARIVPLLTTRSVVKLDDRQAAKKLEHWRAVVVAACEQSGRAVIPDVAEPQTFAEYCSAPADAATRIVLSPSADRSLAAYESPSTTVNLLIGPEGGLEDAELALAVRGGHTPARLGPRILRTETAAIVALSILQARWGDLL